MLGYSENRIIKGAATEKVWIYDRFYPVVTSPTGRKWTGMNLGANRVANSAYDTEAYGWLFEWGRGFDGHQLRNSGTTTTTSSTDVPGHDLYIVKYTTPYDWRIPQNDNLWQGEIVEGWRLPTAAEWAEEIATWSGLRASHAYDSVLKLPAGGYRTNYGLSGVGNTTFFATKTTSSILFEALRVYVSIDLNFSNAARVIGSAVRLIKDQ